MKETKGNEMNTLPNPPAEIVLDLCSWSFCDRTAYATWARKGYCYSCYREIMDSKD
jgi:hypothetical protein